MQFARANGGFDPKKLPKDLRVAMDSMLLEGAGRVEDTLNLLGHAARKLVECVADLVDKPYRQICVSAGIPVLLATSIKKGLDCEWSDSVQKADALQHLLEQLESLQDWITRRLPNQINEPPLDKHVRLLRELVAQDLEADPNDPGGKRLRTACRFSARTHRHFQSHPNMRRMKGPGLNGCVVTLRFDTWPILEERYSGVCRGRWWPLDDETSDAQAKALTSARVNKLLSSPPSVPMVDSCTDLNYLRSYVETCDSRDRVPVRSNWPCAGWRCAGRLDRGGASEECSPWRRRCLRLG